MRSFDSVRTSEAERDFEQPVRPPGSGTTEIPPVEEQLYTSKADIEAELQRLMKELELEGQ